MSSSDRRTARWQHSPRRRSRLRPRLRSSQKTRHSFHPPGRLLFEAMRNSIAASEKNAFRVVHFSIQSNHLHLIVEATDESTLSRGMQGLSIRMARAVHRALGHRGTIFADRYHAHQLETPRETRAALLYVLQNWAKHGRGGDYDPRSSAIWFDGWVRPPAASAEEPIVARPRTWLVRLGWRRHGLLRPGERPRGHPSSPR